MSSVPSFIRKPCRCIPLLLSCWMALSSGFVYAAMTSVNSSPSLTLAQEALKNEESIRAEEILHNLLKVEKENPLAHRLLGNILLQRGKIEEAIFEFTTALQIDPHDEVTRDFLFSIYYNRAQKLLDDPQEAYKARDSLETAIAIRPNGVMSYYYLGTLNYQEKRYSECIATLQKVVNAIPEQLHPNLHSMLYNSAFNLLNQHRAQEAQLVIPYFSTAQATINELLLTATISFEIGDFAKAIELYDRILTKDPLHAVTLHNRVIAQQRFDEAE